VKTANRDDDARVTTGTQLTVFSALRGYTNTRSYSSKIAEKKSLK
jgi:hypothetical protein